MAVPTDKQCLLSCRTCEWCQDAPAVLQCCRPPRGNTALVGQVSGNAPLVLLLCPANERGVEDEAILGRVALGFQGPKEGLFGSQDLYG